jgi:hypothetical protein
MAVIYNLTWQLKKLFCGVFLGLLVSIYDVARFIS